MVTLGRHNFGLGHGGGPGTWWLSFSGKFGKSAVDRVILVYELEIVIPYICVLNIESSLFCRFCILNSQFCDANQADGETLQENRYKLLCILICAWC